MALLNSLYGDPAGGFGVRTVTVSSNAVTLQPSPMPRPKKSGKRTSAKCTACGEVSLPVDFSGNVWMQSCQGSEQAPTLYLCSHGRPLSCC